MKLFLVANITSEEKILRCQGVADALSSYHEVSLLKEEAALLSRPDFARFPIEEADLVISIGGDGTLLKASHIAYPADRPLIGLNAGHIGALCAHRYDDFDPANPLKGCELVDRYGLVFHSAQYDGFALNDIVITSPTRAKSTMLKISYGEEMRMRGDGVLIATPTGSTAYNRSLGGPTLDIGEKANILMPLASLDTSINHPFLIKKEQEIVVEPVYPAHNPPAFVYDGLDIGRLTSPMKIVGSPRPLKVYRKITKA